MTGLTTSRDLGARASVILHQCGGAPGIEDLQRAEPRTGVAWDAYHVSWYLTHARDEMRWLHQYRSRPVDSLAHGYRTFREAKQRARLFVEIAFMRLHLAEAGLKALEGRAS